MKFKTILAASVFAMSAGAASAADLSVAMPMTDPGFDWSGLYAGMGFSGSLYSNGIVSGTEGNVHFVLGANHQIDSIVIGGEVWAGAYLDNFGFTGVMAGADARIGMLASPDVLIYGQLSGVAYDAGALYGGIGGGIEFAVTDNVSFDVNYTFLGLSNNAFVGHRVTADANFHF